MKRLTANLRMRFLAGIVVTVPVVVTFLALRFVFRNLDALLGPWVVDLVGYQLPGLGILATLILVFLTGVVATNLIGRRLISMLERIVTELPLIRTIYNASKDIVETATLARRRAFQEVVMVEYPRRGVYSYGFVTGYAMRQVEDGPQQLANVFIPGPPVPTTGVLVAVPTQELYHLDLSVEEGLKIILSAGMSTPAELRERSAAAPVGVVTDTGGHGHG